MKNEPSPEQKTLAEQAAEWVFRLEDGPVPFETRSRYEAWRAQSPEHQQVYEHVRAIWQSGALENAPDVLAIHRQSVVLHRRRFNLAVSVAAAVLVAIGGGAGILFSQDVPQTSAPTGLATMSAPDHGLFSTSVGERSAIALADGSVLTLDTDSSARVEYGPRERTIYLLRGQALFDVAKHKSHPFVVHAGDRRIVATGTSFNVRLDKSAVEVTLVEGHVMVDQAQPYAPGAPNTDTELNPGERLIARRGAGVKIALANVSAVTDWRNGRLVFDDERLDDAVREVNRYSKVRIELSDPKLGALRISGLFPAGRPEAFANSLRQMFSVTVKPADDGHLVVTSRDPH